MKDGHPESTVTNNNPSEDGQPVSLSGVDIHALLTGLQRKLLSEQQVDHEIHRHPTASGDAGEINWCAVIDQFLPNRYAISSKAFVIDALGEATPEQIDVLVHDRHFCPLWFEDRAGTRYVPAESVFAAIEVKPELDLRKIGYAGEKAASVRRLHRTSAPIVDRGQVRPPREPFEILGGILALKSAWSPPFGEPFRAALSKQAASYETRIDIGCALQHGAFELVPKPVASKPTVELSESKTALMFFLLRFFGRLQQIGSPMAIDMRQYTQVLKVDGLQLVGSDGRQ